MTQVKTVPKVIASGYLAQFDNIAVYNLDNGQRVFRLTDMTMALRGKSHGKFANYLAASNIEEYLPKKLVPDKNQDREPRGITIADNNGQEMKTYDAEDFIDICAAFIQAADDNQKKLSIAQQEIAERAKRFVLSTAKIGITGLIDEATGYQYIRPSNELELKFAFYLADELRPWEKTFPDQFWVELGRLTNWPDVKRRPKYWGKLVNEFVYQAMDKDIANYLKENKPPKYTGQRYHQWLDADRGVRALTEHLWQVIGLAKTCSNVDELRYEVQKNFKGDIFQQRLFSPKQLKKPNNALGNKVRLEKAIEVASTAKQASLLDS